MIALRPPLARHGPDPSHRRALAALVATATAAVAAAATAALALVPPAAPGPRAETRSAVAARELRTCVDRLDALTRRVPPPGGEREYRREADALTALCRERRDRHREAAAGPLLGRDAPTLAGGP